MRRLGEPGEEEVRGRYRQRWTAGTVMFMVKRRWGEALLQGVVYNLNRLIRLGFPA